jgi:diguanylate cyclase
MSFLGLPSLVGLLVQAMAVLLIAALCLVLQRTVQREPLSYWSAGWLLLFGGLTALFLSFQVPLLQRVGQSLYLLGEYLFGYLLIAGCRRYVSGRRIERREAWLLLPALFVAVFLPRLGGGDFNIFFIIHTLIYAYLFFAAFRVLWTARRAHSSFVGFRVMLVATAALTLGYLHYAPLFAGSYFGVLPTTVPYLEYSPLYDLILLVMLAFGMVMVTTGEVQRELQLANANLAATRDRLSELAQMDHLTSALNRHAFYSIIGDPAGGEGAMLRGCAAVADIDNMKSINDRYGHAAGDAAIRAVASAIRSCIRADDLLFRWGGDEFLILLIGVSESEAHARLDHLDIPLRWTAIAGIQEPVSISVSVGYAPFESAASLDEVIALADTAMYGKKRTATAAAQL